MFTIAICEDELDHIIILEKQINNYSKKNNIIFDINSYKSAGKFLYFAKNRQIDIAFLDINLGDVDSGVDVGIAIRDTLQSYGTKIIYISSLQKYSRELINTNPLKYLVKPVGYSELAETLDLAVKTLYPSQEHITIRTRNGIVRISYPEILYIESSGRKCKIHTINRCMEYNAKLSELIEQINSTSFVPIHKSYLVNFGHVVSYKYQMVTLDNGENLAISQSHRKEVRAFYLCYTE